MKKKALPIILVIILCLLGGLFYQNSREKERKEFARKKEEAVLTIEANQSKVSDKGKWNVAVRSEEHTSELQSRFDLVCRLLLETHRAHRVLHSFPTRRSSDLMKKKALPIILVIILCLLGGLFYQNSREKERKEFARKKEEAVLTIEANQSKVSDKGKWNVAV